jgi:hypothetical protein
MSYYVIKVPIGDDLEGYVEVGGGIGFEQKFARRFASKANALRRCCTETGDRPVRVRRGRHAAWKPIICAALEMQRRWDARESPAKQQDAIIEVVTLCRELGEEHRP